MDFWQTILYILSNTKNILARIAKDLDFFNQKWRNFANLVTLSSLH